MQNFLDWDDEAPTKETPLPASHARLSALRAAAAEPSIEMGPPTEVDVHDPAAWRLWDREDDDEVTRPESQPPTARRDAPGRTLVSEGPPSADDGFDRRTTARRLVAPSAELIAAASIDPRSAAVPLVRQLPPRSADASRSSSSLPPMVMPASPPPPAQDRELLQEVLRLRRWVRLTGVLGVAALAACTVLAALLARAYDRPVLLDPAVASAFEEAPAPLAGTRLTARSAIDGLRLTIDGVDRGPLPLELTDLAPGRHELVFAGPEGYAPLGRSIELSAGEALDLGDIALEPQGIEVLLTVLSFGTTVSIAKKGEPSRIISGPFPRKIRLEPGTYALFAARGGHTYARPLYLSRERGSREVIIP